MTSVQSMVVAGAFVILFAMLAALLIRTGRRKTARKFGAAWPPRPNPIMGSPPPWGALNGMPLPLSVPNVVGIGPELQELRAGLRVPPFVALEEVAVIQLLIAGAGRPLNPQQLRACEILCEFRPQEPAHERYQRASHALRDPSARPTWSEPREACDGSSCPGVGGSAG